MKTVIDILLIVIFGITDKVWVVLGVFYILGLWKMLKKSGIPSWWALVPCANEYWLANCAGRESEGQAVALTSLLARALNIAVLFIPRDSDSIAAAFAFIILIIEIIRIAYMIQVCDGLIEVYNVRKWWMVPWIFLNFLPAMIWGFSKKYNPQTQSDAFRESAITHVTGGDVAQMGEGLSINLKERYVTEFFRKKYLLRDIHMNIKPGRLVMLLGGSGAGKTTLLNAINGYEKANAKVTLNGRDIYAEYKKIKYEVGFVPQSDLMRGKDSVYHTLLDAAMLRLPTDYTLSDRRARVLEVMNVFGLSRAKNTLVEKMSGGQRKRLSIAMEFISNPELFILDEPDSGLDGVMARELFVQLRKVADTGRIVIVITHTPDRVVDLFDDVIILAKDSANVGRLAFYGPVDEAREFFGRERMEQIVKAINRPDEGGEGLADEFITKFAEVQHGRA